MAKYRRKSEVVEAVQWFSGMKHPNVEQTQECLKYKEGLFYQDPESDLFDAEVIVSGDYILTHSDGSISAMSKKKFNEKYEKVTCSLCGGKGKCEYKHSSGMFSYGKCDRCNGTGGVQE